jgi:hypothetical protein
MHEKAPSAMKKKDTQERGGREDVDMLSGNFRRDAQL